MITREEAVEARLARLLLAICERVDERRFSLCGLSRAQYTTIIVDSSS